VRQNPAEKLCAFVIRTYGLGLTPVQLRGPWTYIGTENGEISGVVIDPDSPRPGYRVMLADIEAPNLSGPARWDVMRGEATP
jgi:hypothetical protein